MSGIEYYSKANKIVTEYGDHWETENSEYPKKIKKLETEISKYDKTFAEFPDLFSGCIEEIKIDVSDLDNIPDFSNKIASNKTLISLCWDMSTPILNDNLDKLCPQYALLKEAIGLKNKESPVIEGNWSRNAHDAFQNEYPYFKNSCDIFTPGQCEILKNRTDAHIAIMSLKPHHQLTIDINKLSQWHLEAKLMGEDAVKKKLAG